MSYPSLISIVWTLVSILGSGTLIAAAIILMRGRGIGPWIMLCGSIGCLIANAGSHVLILIMNTRGFDTMKFMTAFSALGGVSWLLICAGVLILALQHRALLGRLAELESILNAHQENR